MSIKDLLNWVIGMIEVNERIMNNQMEEGMEYNLKVDAKGARGEGIGRIGNFVIFIKDAKTRIGNTYKIRVTKKYRTFCHAELMTNDKKLIGDTTIIQ